MKLAELLTRPIAYHRVFADLGGVHVAVFLSQALYWTNVANDKDNWFYKTRDQWQEETGLTRREQESARKILKEKDILLEQKKGAPAMLYYKIKTDILSKWIKETSVSRTVPTRRAEPYQLKGTNRTNLKGGTVPTIYTETTTETTTDITPNVPLANKSSQSSASPQYKKEFLLFLDAFNKAALSKFRFTPDTYKKYLLRRKIYSVEELIHSAEVMLSNSFYRGDNDRGWRASPEYLLRKDDIVERFVNEKINKKDKYGYVNYDDIRHLVEQKKI